MFLRSIPPKHVKMMVIWCNSAKKDWFCAQFGKNALQSIFNQGKFLRGLLLLVRISSRGKISKQSISPHWSHQTHGEKKVPKKICRLKFRFLCLDRKSWVSWSHFLDSKPFAALSFLAYAWFPKRHFIMVDSAKTRRKWWFYSFNSAKKGGVWAQFGRNALQYISNRGHLLGSLLLLVHIYSNGKNLKKTDQQKVSCILL